MSAFRGQNYGNLKKDCIKKGILFEDPEFPPTSKSLYHTKIDNDVEWLRPKELCKVPRLVVEGITCDDLVTGELKNAWFITACTALAHEPKLWNKVVPEVKNQEWSEKNEYAGIFHFNFWRFGEWVDVVIDDRLPTKDGKLIFLRSNARNEFWSALLEKAYAKMFGDYEALGKGHAADALVDFTGGVSEKLDIKGMDFESQTATKALFNKLCSAYENRALINCHIRCDPTQVSNDGPNGLVLGQGYNITMVADIEIKKSYQSTIGADSLRMVRLFNPWSPREWTGAWSDNSPEWKNIPANEWSKMGVKFQNEGEFWMSFDDFLQHFTDVDICHFVNTSFFTLKKTWNEAIMFGEWSAMGKNGGNEFNSNTFLSNPQFLFDITTDEPDPVMISIEQRDVTVDRVSIGENKNTIGFYIMKVEENRKFRVHIRGEQKFRSDFLKSRNVFGTCNLDKGRYVIIPCCANSDGVGQFMLRLYTGNKASANITGKLLRELTQEGPKSGCCTTYKLVTTITVEKLQGIELPESAKTTLDPYVVIRCEGEKVQSDFVESSSSPEFNVKATFYRKDPVKNPIVVEIYNHNRIIDDYICEARIEWNASETPEKKTFTLTGRNKEAAVKKPGSLFVEMSSSDDLQML